MARDVCTGLTRWPKQNKSHHSFSSAPCSPREVSTSTTSASSHSTGPAAQHRTRSTRPGRGVRRSALLHAAPTRAQRDQLLPFAPLPSLFDALATSLSNTARSIRIRRVAFLFIQEMRSSAVATCIINGCVSVLVPPSAHFRSSSTGHEDRVGPALLDHHLWCRLALLRDTHCLVSGGLESP